MREQFYTLKLIVCVFTLALLSFGGTRGQEQDGAAGNDPQAQSDYQAVKMFRQATSLLEDRQEERAVKLLTALPLNFPKSNIRFKAGLTLGKHYTEKGDHELAIKTLTSVADSKDAAPEEQAEALYRVGVCHFGLSAYNRALTILRRVTEEHPWSVFANEAYYYIGLCHFRLERWRNAVDALRMVGTSVAPNTKSQTLVESGQRFMIKVQDKDLRVLKRMGGALTVQVTTQSGDAEPVPVSPFDSEGETYLGSINTELGKAHPNDGKLQVRGADVINVEYADANTQDGTRDVKRIGASRVVSTASVGFMDGAFREYVHGVFAAQNTFIRVKDFDADVSDQADEVKVRIYTRHKVETEDEATRAAADDAPEYVTLDELELSLKETAPHSGFFTSKIVVNEAKDTKGIDKNDAGLSALDKDTVHLEYLDKEHIGGLDDPKTATARGDFLTGQIQDVWIAHREVNTEQLRARKNLIEAQFYLKLAQIFKDVGLVDRATTKADIGLEKTADVLRRSIKASISQDFVEEAYKLKWELLLAKGDLDGAIQTCHTLMAMFPSSSLADLALLQIARARIDSGESAKALPILRGILTLNTADEQKAEAQFLIARILERNAEKSLSAQQRLSYIGQAVAEYKACADKYPGSAFAGESMGKVIDFYIESKDYDRSMELLQTVFTDFPDAPFLDEMLLKWGVVLARLKRYDEAREKLQQLLDDYPNSSAGGKAEKFLKLVSQRAAE